MAGESGSFWQLERVNRRRTAALVVKLTLIFAAFGLAYDFLFHNLRFSDGRLSGVPWITALAVLLAVARCLRAYFAGAGVVLDAMDAHPISSDQPKNQAVIDVVHELALAARIPEPPVNVIDDPSPNAFALGRDPEHSVLCVSQGLLDQMDREELQGVIGHEIAHIRNCDTQLTTMVTAMFGGFGVFRFLFRAAVPPIWKEDGTASGGGGLLARAISIMLSREREYLADASAVEFTRNPTALIRALEQISKTASPLRCATRSNAQLFIVDPFQRAGGATSYKQYINEITRLRLQPGKTEEERGEEAKNFAVNQYPRNMLAEKMSSHPPLGERIQRLQALIHAAPEGAAASGLTEAQLKAEFSVSAQFVQNLARTDPRVMATILQSTLAALPGESMLLRQITAGIQTQRESPSAVPTEQQLYESNLASTGDLGRDPLARPGLQKFYQSPLAPTGDLPTAESPAQMLLEAFRASSGRAQLNLGGDPSSPPASAADPAGRKGVFPPLSADEAAIEREALAKMLGPVVASMRPKKAVTRPAPEPPSGSRGVYLFWFVIAFSAAAIVASFAIR